MAMMTETDLELGDALEGIVEMFRYLFINFAQGYTSIFLEKI